MRQEDPFTGFMYRLTLGHIEIAGYSECTGLEMETKVFEYPEGGLNFHTLKFPERTNVKNIVLKRGLTVSHDLFDWYLDVANGTFSHANQRPSAHDQAGHSSEASEQDNSRRISIAIVNASGETTKEWLLRRAFPIKWIGPDLKATDNSVAFETIELAHEGMEMVTV